MENRYEKILLISEPGIDFEIMQNKEGEMVIKAVPSDNSENYKNPPIPKGYKHILGEWNDGFVIERESDGSQFVWVPVLEGATTRNVKKYGGFYISRYYISNEGCKPVSKANCKPLTNCNINFAIKVASEFETENTHLTTDEEFNLLYKWINTKIESVETKRALKEPLITGIHKELENKHICDLGLLCDITEKHVRDVKKMYEHNTYIPQVLLKEFPYVQKCPTGLRISLYC